MAAPKISSTLMAVEDRAHFPDCYISQGALLFLHFEAVSFIRAGSTVLSRGGIVCVFQSDAAIGKWGQLSYSHNPGTALPTAKDGKE